MKKEEIAVSISGAMLCAAFVIAFSVLSSCTSSVDGSGFIADYDEARRATIEAWEDVVGPVSQWCVQRTEGAIVVEVGSTDDYPEKDCGLKNLADGYLVGECTYAPKINSAPYIIYILSGRTELAKTDSAVHGWTHALSHCMYGDGDREHADILLWAEYGPNTVEAHGCANLRL